MLDCLTFDAFPDLSTDERAYGFASHRTPSHVRHSLSLLHRAIRCDYAGRVAVVSSFGADSAVLLALVAEIDPATPVLFVDTRQHFRRHRPIGIR